jgi:lipopolysaccharide export LptBFGC system permease protein LptF
MSNPAPANTSVAVTAPASAVAPSVAPAPAPAAAVAPSAPTLESVLAAVSAPASAPRVMPEHRCENNGKYFYTVFHTLMALLAIYLSYRCNKEFRLGSFLVALFFPYIYIIYVLATEGTCGILENAPVLRK